MWICALQNQMSLIPAESLTLSDNLPTRPKLAPSLILLRNCPEPSLFSLNAILAISVMCWTSPNQFLRPNLSPKCQILSLGPQNYGEEALLLLSKLLNGKIIYLFSSVKHGCTLTISTLKFPLAGSEFHLRTKHSSSLYFCQGTVERNDDIPGELGHGTSWYFSSQSLENLQVKQC